MIKIILNFQILDRRFIKSFRQEHYSNRSFFSFLDHLYGKYNSGQKQKNKLKHFTKNPFINGFIRGNIKNIDVSI
jgi:hypothetical protein